MSSKKEVSSGTEKAEKLTTAAENNTEKQGDNSKASKTVKNEENGGARKINDNSAENDKEKSIGAKKNAKNNIKDNAEKVNGAKMTVNSKTNSNKPKKKSAIKADGAKLSAQDEKKLKAAQIKAERKQKRLDRKLAYKEKLNARQAQIKAKREERKAKAQERKDKMQSLSIKERMTKSREERLAKIEERNAKRQAKLAEMRAEREHKLKVRAEKRAEQQQKHRNPGFGGWLAAVISLGATTLALGTILTYGWMNFNTMRAGIAGVQTQSIYELNSIIDNLDGNLAKARIANSSYDRTRILTNIAIESEMAETILERMPLECTVTEKTTAFVNKMGESAKELLYKVASGKKLTESDEKAIEYMYKTNLQVKRAINEMTMNMSEKDILAMMDGKKDCLMLKTFSDLQNNTIQTPKEIQDGPFSSSIEKTSAKNLEGMKDITAPEAENVCKEYFKDYKIKDAKCTGEASSKQIELFNVSITLDDDSEMLAQISKKGGKVVMFDSYKECTDKNFSVERCIDIAEDFLKDLGYDEMKAVWTSENGSTCNLNFAYENDDVVYYTDMIKVKVCEQRGIVTGIEALPYVLNHTKRSTPTATVSIANAKKSVSANISISNERLAVIPFEGEERLVWELIGNASGLDYYVYVDAKTGEELEVFTVVNTKQGKALM